MSYKKEEPICIKKNKSNTITPYRLSLAILIRNFHHIRELDNNQELEKVSTFYNYVRDFCVLLVKLLQSPDLELVELWNLLTYHDYNLPDSLNEYFKQDLININSNGIGALMDVIDSFSRVMSNDDSDTLTPRNKISISKSSVVGFYLRRLLINFDKLTISEVTELYRSFGKYTKCLFSLNSSSTGNDLSTDDRPQDKNLWTRRQAELFIAIQAALIDNNEEKAMHPRDIQNIIYNVLKTNPDLAEAHFLTYLNYLRVKDFCGAVESLYHCFDLNKTGDIKISMEDTIKIGRFAALNLAVLYHHFGHNQESLSSLREAIRIAQDANDKVCLQHALSWLHRLLVTNTDKMIEHSVRRSFGPSLSYRTSLGIQKLVQLSCHLSAEPSHIFEALAKSDVLYYEQSHRDLIANSYAIKSGLWQFYGKPDMSSLLSQLLMYLNVDNTSSSRTYDGESFCLSLCNVAMNLQLQGCCNLVYCILNISKTRFPHEPNSQIWTMCDGLFHFIRALYHEDWSEAESACTKIQIIDKWESYLRLAELYLYKQDYVEANKCICMIFENHIDADSFKSKGHQSIRRKMMNAEIHFASHLSRSIPPGIMDELSNCLTSTNKYQMDYHTSMVYLHMANLQVHLQMVSQAMVVMEKSMVQIMAHGGCYDRARALLLFVKCLIASCQESSEKEKIALLKKGVVILDEIKNLFVRVQALSRMKDVVYLQARLYSNLNMKQDRNRCALEFRLMDGEHKTNNAFTLTRNL